MCVKGCDHLFNVDLNADRIGEQVEDEGQVDVPEVDKVARSQPVRHEEVKAKLEAVEPGVVQFLPSRLEREAVRGEPRPTTRHVQRELVESVQEETVVLFTLDCAFVGLHIVAVKEGLDVVVVDRVGIVLVEDDVVCEFADAGHRSHPTRLKFLNGVLFFVQLRFSVENLVENGF